MKYRFLKKFLREVESGYWYCNMNQLANLSLVLAFLFSCASDAVHNSRSDNPLDSVPKRESPITFYVVGDWGRMGNANQMAVANQMNQWASQEEPDFIISTGDNFYDEGVTSTTDPLWLRSYETVYDGQQIDQKPWYVVLGNHDYEGNPDAEVSYSLTHPQWIMPDRYYQKVKSLGGDAQARFIFLDTTPIDESGNTSSTARQIKWVDSLTTLTDVEWKIAVGHHHIYTGGYRKGEPNPVRVALEPIFEKNKVDVYFCGHEHDLQHLKAAAKPTHYFISGAGSDIRETGTGPQSLFSASIQGFMSVNLTKNKMSVKIISHEGNVLYQYEINHQN